MLSTKRKIQLRERAKIKRGYKRFVLAKKRTLKAIYYGQLKAAPNIKSLTSRPVAKKYNKQNITVPCVFSVHKNMQGVVDFLSIVRAKKYPQNSYLCFDCANVTEIDHPAMVMFFTQLNSLSATGVRYYGTLPLNTECKQSFIDSGFLDNMIKLNGGKFPTNGDDLILRTGKDKTESKLTGQAIKKVLLRLIGAEQNYEPVQSIIQEMTGNSVEHAYNKKIERHWILGIHFTDDQALFTVSDGGIGIIKTLNRKHKKFVEFTKNPIEILERAFDKKYFSITDEENRYKGLQRIKTIFEEKKILSLKIITNNVFLDFRNTTNSANLKSNYPGTIYAWTIDKELLTHGTNN